MTVRLQDEAAQINPNLASPALVEALLRVTGSDAEIARRLATAIDEWVGAPAVAIPREAVLAEYRKAGLDYGSPNEPLETVDELQRVVGMTPSVFAAIRPHLSLFAPAEPSLAHADPVVAAAVAVITQPGTPPPKPSDVSTARIAVTALGPDNGRATRTAIVRILPASGTYMVLAWDSDLN